MFTDFFKVVSTRRKKKAVDTKGFVQIGEDGLFFERLDEAYLNSPTATMCLLKFHEFCVPPGLLDQYQALWKKIESDYIRYGYYLLNVEYNVDAEPIAVHYKNPKHFLVKEKDDNDNASTFINKKTGVTYPTFNSDKAIVFSQFVDTKGGYRKYLGQIYMYNDSPLPYRITPLYSVQRWMETEDDAPTYITKASDNAMFGNNIYVMKKTSDASAKELEVLGEVKEALRGAKSVENAAQNLLLEWEGDVEDVPKLISKVEIGNDVDVDLFNAADDKASKKICMACYNFPRLLLFEDVGVFGESGASIETATKEWAKTCQREANNILDGFKEIGITITKPIVENGSINNPDPSGA